MPALQQGQAPSGALFYSTLAALANPARAVAMRAYMRDQFDFLGIPTPARREAVTPLLRQLKGASADDLLRLADELWARPERECQYVALDMMAMHWKQFGLDKLPALEKFALRKSWWDTVDGIAGIIGSILRFGHEGMDAALSHDNFWMRRIAMLHQLGWRSKTDEMRLFRYALALSHENEFFIQKAIGWALRDYARHAPDNVSQFLVENRLALPRLSFREASKHLRL
jgi:3-methyladenine DNA glycosylase AlkD